MSFSVRRAVPATVFGVRRIGRHGRAALALCGLCAVLLAPRAVVAQTGTLEASSPTARKWRCRALGFPWSARVSVARPAWTGGIA